MLLLVVVVISLQWSMHQQQHATSVEEEDRLNVLKEHFANVSLEKSLFIAAATRHENTIDIDRTTVKNIGRILSSVPTMNHDDLAQTQTQASTADSKSTVPDTPSQTMLKPVLLATKIHKEQSRAFSWLDAHQFARQKIDLICKGCYQHIFSFKNETNGESNRNVTCGELIEQKKLQLEYEFLDTVDRNSTAMIIDAAISIAKTYPDHCQRCDPRSCSNSEKVYLRYDDAAPTVLRAWTRPISKALPEHLIFPPEGVQNLKSFFAKAENRYSKSKMYYFEYNPSLVALTGEDADLIPRSIFDGGTQLTRSQQPAFLSTHRESVYPTIFQRTDKIDKRDWGMFPPYWQKHEHINFSFLNENMTVIDEGIFHVGYADYRIFILHHQIYLGKWNRLHPIWIVPANHANTDNVTITKSGHQVNILREIYNPENCRFEIYMAQQHLCCAGGCKGKNYNYFTTDDGNIWVQTNPAGPLEVQKVDSCDSETTSSSGLIYKDDTMPQMSFGTFDEPYLASLGVFHNDRLSKHRGGGCCVRMAHPLTRQELLIGVSHRKDNGSPKWKAKMLQYTSNFYATLSEPPFSLVAMSGSFCMGHPQTPEEFDANHLAPMTRLLTFKFGIDLDCPTITYLQSMVENPSNPDNIIIGYGINDMMNRFAEVSKANILQMLFDPYGTA